MDQRFLTLLHEAMRRCAGTRPLFHSEADFQLELGHQLRTHNPEMDFRLEMPIRCLGFEVRKNKFVDLVMTIGNDTCLVELKYPKAKLDVTVGGERYMLPSPAADMGRHGFLKDIERLENFSTRWPGIALLLTNDARLWSPQHRQLSDHEFQIDQGRTVSGQMAWAPGTAEKTVQSYPGVSLHNSYTMNWLDYAMIPHPLRYVTAVVARRQ